MRTILVFAILIGSATPAFGTTGGSLAMAVRSERDATLLTVMDSSADPFKETLTRFVVLPHGAMDPEVRLLPGSEGEVPVLGVTAGSVMVLRGHRVLPLTIAAITHTQAGGARGTARINPSSIEVEIRHRPGAYGQETEQPSAAARYGRGFLDAFASLFPEGQMRAVTAADEGSYLIITPPQFLSAVEPLAVWKTEKGLSVSLVTTEETGTTNRQIQQYISTQYHQAERPPQYVLLVGDVEQVPSFDFHSVVSDHPYSLTDGDDFLPDLFVGRLSAQSLPEVQTVVAKILRYERDPFVEPGADWYSRGLVVGADYASATPVAVSRWCKEQMLRNGFAQVDSCYFPPYWTDYLRLIPTAINRGVSVVTYRGWARSIEGWEVPVFTQNEVAALANGWKLPVVMSFVCRNNDFGSPVCFGEAWIRAGSASEPKGAVAFIGNSEPWSHTRFNDAAAIGAFKAIGRSGAQSLGAILASAKVEWFLQFPSEIPYGADGKESVEFYFYIYNLLGDPEMALRIGNPRTVEVVRPAAIPEGSNFLEIQVDEAGGGDPVAGVRVGLSRDGMLLGSTFSDANGLAHIPGTFDGPGGPVMITITGPGIATYRDSLAVVPSPGSFLVSRRIRVDDDNAGASHGNGDGIANPGETLELTVSLENRGGSAATGIAATISGPAGITIDVPQVSFPDIAPGSEGSSTTPFVVRPDPKTEAGAVFRLSIVAVTQAAPPTERSYSDLELAVAAPSLRYVSAAIDGDGVLAPGETANLTVSLVNDGTVPSSGATGVLRTSTPDLVVVEGGEADFGPITPGGTAPGLTSYRVRANAQAAMGQAAVLELALTTTEGYESTTSFSLTIGVTDHSAPLGPDAYGYYAYDNSDTDYPDAAPLYDWIECSTAYGGSGTRLDLEDNETTVLDLPFPFQYYGKSYTRILVSDNGWISFDLESYYDWYNWHMPNTYGSAAQIAPFWDNLNPKKVLGDTEILVGDGIYHRYDAARHLFVIEWSRQGNARPERDDLQTFELILYDPSQYPTPTGDGVIGFQYKQIVNNDDERMFATVGIEDETEEMGLEYSYSNLYPPAAAPISSGLAIMLTTQPPRFRPFRLADFRASRNGSGILVSWEPIDQRPRSGYRILRASKDGDYKEITPGMLDASVRSFTDATADPEVDYLYMISSGDPVGRETVLGPFPYTGRLEHGPVLALTSRTPNPFHGLLELNYAVPKRSAVFLYIHDLSGRLVRTLFDGRIFYPGAGTVTWDGRDDADRDLPSGLYLCTLRSGIERRTLKVTLIR